MDEMKNESNSTSNNISESNHNFKAVPNTANKVKQPKIKKEKVKKEKSQKKIFFWKKCCITIF